MKISYHGNDCRFLSKPVRILAVLWFCLVGVMALPAQTLSGTLNAYAHPDFAGISSQFHMEDAKLDGVTYLGGSMNLFCADLPGKSIDEDISSYPHYHASFTLGSLSQLTIWDRFSNPQNEALAVSMLRWAVNNYYLTHFLEPVNDEHARRYAFQNVVWEVLGDGGTSEGLSYTTGNINRSKFAPDGSAYNATLWGYMTEMLDAVSSSGVTTAYEPEFRVEAALDARSNYQDYLFISSDKSFLIPEPSVALFLGAAGFLAMGRRRRWASDILTYPPINKDS